MPYRGSSYASDEYPGLAVHPGEWSGRIFQRASPALADAARMTHSVLEHLLVRKGGELMRQLLQADLDLRSVATAERRRGVPLRRPPTACRPIEVTWLRSSLPRLRCARRSRGVQVRSACPKPATT